MKAEIEELFVLAMSGAIDYVDGRGFHISSVDGVDYYVIFEKLTKKVKFQSFLKTGELRATQGFTNGKAEGWLRVYREDGTLEWADNFKHGLKHGKSIDYGLDGKTIIKYFMYEHGRLIG